MSPDTLVDRICAVSILFVLISSGFMSVAAMEVGPVEVKADAGPIELEDIARTVSRSKRAPIYMPDEALFADPPKENRILPIYTGEINQAYMDHYDDLGVGGMVINNWQWSDADLQHVKDKDWTVWVNDYYMYPSGNANPHGGVHETFWNPGFEEDSLGMWPDGWVWTYYDWPKYDRTGTKSHSGRAAVACDDFNFMFWPQGVEPGWEYNISAWAMGTTGTEIGRMIVHWYNIDTMISSNFSLFQTGPTYDRFSMTALAPAGATAAKILIQGHNTGQFVWFDDVMVRKEEQLSSNSVFNPDLEIDSEPDGQPDGWSPSNSPSWDSSGTYSHSGNGAARVNASNIYIQPIAVQNSTDYYLGQWIRSETGAVYTQLVVLWVDAGWNLAGIDQDMFFVGDTYTYHDRVFRSPWNATTALVILASAQNPYVYVDDVNFDPLSPLCNGVSRGPVLDGHPELEAQGLYYNSEDVTGGQPSALDIPSGEIVSAVAAPIRQGGNLDLDSVVDVSGNVVGGQVVWTPGSGNWRVMVFAVDILYNGTEVDPAITNMHQINVMNKVAVQRFIDEMYKKTIYDKTSDHFGNMIVASFTDEVSNLAGYFLQGEPYPVVAWLDDDVNDLHFEDEFTVLHGYDLVQYLPALWNDVGPRTAKYKVDFYNTTAYLQGQAFYKMIGDWCQDHGINFSGHLLSEDSLVQHTAFYGDFFENIKYMGYPGMDTLLHSAGEIDQDLTVPKLVSSASVLYDKPHTMTEYSVAASSMNLRNMTAVANWQAVQGIDILTSFSFWVGVMPDDDLRAHSEHVGRTNYMLQQGDYTADIAVLYPITTIQAEYVPSTEVIWNKNKFPGFDHDESFKNVTRSLLTGQLDFIYMNDESLYLSDIDNSSGEAVLNHGVSGLDLKVLVVPEMDVIRTETMEMIRDFYDAGGIVAAVGDLPSASGENGTDQYITDLVEHVFDTSAVGAKGYNMRTNANGGMSLKADGDPDVLEDPIRTAMEPDLVLSAEDLYIYYMKRTAPGFDIYFLVNNKDVDSVRDYEFKILGDPYAWDPETGVVQALSGNDYSYDPVTGYTTMDSVTVKGFSSAFIVFKKPVIDIDADSLTFDPAEPLEGDMVTIGVNVTNLGHGIAPQVKVKAFDGSPENGTQIGHTDTVSIAGLGAEALEFDWDTANFPHMRNITVQACLPDGTCVSIGRDFFVNTPPWVGIEVDKLELLTFEYVNLSTNISDVGYPIHNFSWDLGDGNSSNLTDVTHSYSDNGVYTVILWVTDANGTVNSSTVDITVLNRAPEALFEVSPDLTGDARTVFVFNASGSSDMDGAVSTHSWDFGDNGTGSGVTVNHTYSRPGNYTVGLTIEDDDGASANTSLNISTENMAPMANFTIAPSEGDVTTTFTFTSNSSDLDGEIVELNWSLGDGTFDTNSTVEHSYSDDGSYEVSLKVMDDNDLWSPVLKRTVLVKNLPPIAKATPSTMSVTVGDHVNLSASGTTDPDDGIAELGFSWDWDDGSSPSTGINVSHIYGTAGTFNVTLNVTDDDGNISTAKVTVTVQEKEKPKPKPDEPDDHSGLIIGVLLAIIIVVVVIILLTRMRKSGPRPEYRVVPHDGEMHPPPEDEEKGADQGLVEDDAEGTPEEGREAGEVEDGPEEDEKKEDG